MSPWLVPLLALVGCSTPDAPPPESAPVPPSAEVPAVDEPETPPPSEADEVKRVVQSHTAEIRTCYETLLKTAPESAGRIELRWEVVEGHVTAVNVVDDTIGDEALVACMSAEIQTWAFPEAVSGDVSWPFAFRPNAAAP